MSITTDLKDSILALGGVAFTVNAGDSLIIEQGVSVAAADGSHAVDLLGANHATISGVIVGLIGLSDQGTAGGSVIAITSTGTISSTHLAMFLSQNGNLNNAGTIFGNDLGLVLWENGNNTIVNSGVIADGPTIGTAALFMPYAGNHVVNNSGLIADHHHSSSFAIYTGSAAGTEHITNTGTIDGVIQLGAANDTYDGHLGHHTGGAIYGDAGSDVIKTGIEADVIQGGDDHDVIIAGAGKDAINGGAGQDNMAGSPGNDTFFFSFATDSGITAGTRDIITDFTHLSDKINLVGIDAITGGGNDAFVFNAAKTTSGGALAQGHVGWYWEDNVGTANDHTIIRMNTDADPANESTIQLNGLINLTAADFVL